MGWCNNGGVPSGQRRFRFLIVYGGQIAQLDMVMMSIVILAVIAFIMYKAVAIMEKSILNKYS